MEGGDTSFDVSLCGNLSDEYSEVYKRYEFWCEGVLFSSLGLCGKLDDMTRLNVKLFYLFIIDPSGLVSNIACIVTLLSADMRKQTFNQMLAILSAIDIL